MPLLVPAVFPVASPAWTAFVARLDSQLGKPYPYPGEYYGDTLRWAADYALGWLGTGNEAYAQQAAVILTNGVSRGATYIAGNSYYPSRWLSRLPLALMWLQGWSNLDPNLVSSALPLFVQWSDAVRDHGYLVGAPESNYGAGHYVYRTLCALCQQAYNTADAPRLIGEVIAYRLANVLPTLASLGGFWSEGWNYGDLACQNHLLAALALRSAGLIDAASEKEWALKVARCLKHHTLPGGSTCDLGDSYAYPFQIPTQGLWSYLSAAGCDGPRPFPEFAGALWGGLDVVTVDAGAPVDLESGTGLLTARSAWGDPTGVWWCLLSGPRTRADHQQCAAGHLEIWRGNDDLLINAPTMTQYQTVSGNSGTKSTYSNLVLCDDGGQLLQNYRWSQGLWYGSPGCTLALQESDAAHLRTHADYAAAYSLSSKAGLGGPCVSLTRDILYERPGWLAVQDRVVLRPGCAHRLQWHFSAQPTVTGDSWSVVRGNSRLDATVLADVPLTTTLEQLTLNGKTFWRVSHQPADPTVLTVSYVTTLRVGSA